MILLLLVAGEGLLINIILKGLLSNLLNEFIPFSSLIASYILIDFLGGCMFKNIIYLILAYLLIPVFLCGLPINEIKSTNACVNNIKNYVHYHLGWRLSLYSCKITDDDVPYIVDFLKTENRHFWVILNDTTSVLYRARHAYSYPLERHFNNQEEVSSRVDKSDVMISP
jgi:hypothetical protein